jgi:starch synthase
VIKKNRKGSQNTTHTKLKVLLCSLYGRSGMLQYASQLANALSKKVKVFVLLPDYSDTTLFDKKVNLLRIKAPPNIIKTVMLTANPAHFSKIIKRMREIDPDIIHFLDNHPWYLFLLPSFKKKKFFVTQHDVMAHSGERLRGKITLLTNKALNKKAEKIIVHGEKLKKELIASVPGKRILVFPMGSFEFYLKWKKKEIKEESNTILFFGRILHYKGLDILLKALKLVRKKTEFRLIIAGEGDLSPYQELMTGELSQNIEIINKYIPEAEVPEYFQKASIVVMPYREASQSGIVPVAYAFKKALICTNVGALSEAVENNKTGMLIEPENPRVLAEKIVYLLKNKEKRKRLGQAGYLKMKKELDWDSIANRLLQEYKKVISY